MLKGSFYLWRCIMPAGAKKVIYIIIDSFHPRALDHCLKKGKTPALSFLIENGSLEQCISVFPTMTPVCTSTLATGAPPSAHGIPGIVWYHRGERRIIDNNSNWLSIFKRGLVQATLDFVYNLNHKQLGWEVRTIYEELEANGYFTAAVNNLIYRGNTEYRAHIPLILKLLTLFELDDIKVYGQKGFCWGQLYQPPGILRQAVKGIEYWRKFGLNDHFSTRAAEWFLKQPRTPDLLTIYWPDTDDIAHDTNADCCDPCLTAIDKKLAKILDCFPSWEKALEEYIFVIVGDHAQSTLIDGKKAYIKLPALLKDYSIARMGDEYIQDRDIAICSNERMAYVYILRHRLGMYRDIVECLLKDTNIDQVMWKEDQWYHVVSHEGTLRFRKGGNLQDSYQNLWELQGEREILNIETAGEYIDYSHYPNALERIAQCLENPNAGELVITAKPGYLLEGEGVPKKHGKGSHGSLQQEDSMVPLIISGTSAKIEKPRLVDVVPFIKGCL